MCNADSAEYDHISKTSAAPPQQSLDVEHRGLSHTAWGFHILLVFEQLVNATEIHFNATQRRLLNRYNLIFSLIKNIAKLIDILKW